jgi:hypothetical protein
MKAPLLISIITLLALASCATLDERCAQRFPSEVKEVVLERRYTDTIITPWSTIEFLDTTVCPPADTPAIVVKTVVKEIPGATIYHEVVCTDTVLVTTDQAKINYLSAELAASQAELRIASSASRQKTWIISALALLAVLLFARLVTITSK